jgi:hypothetical protein
MESLNRKVWVGSLHQDVPSFGSLLAKPLLPRPTMKFSHVAVTAATLAGFAIGTVFRLHKHHTKF